MNSYRKNIHFSQHLSLEVPSSLMSEVSDNFVYLTGYYTQDFATDSKLWETLFNEKNTLDKTCTSNT